MVRTRGRQGVRLTGRLGAGLGGFVDDCCRSTGLGSRWIEGSCSWKSAGRIEAGSSSSGPRGNHFGKSRPRWPSSPRDRPTEVLSYSGVLMN